MPSVKPDNLTEKEAKAVEVYANTGNKLEAARQAYPDSTNPDKMAEQVFARPRVKAGVQEALDKLGITKGKILLRFDKIADKSKNDNARVKANENLAQLADLYPDKTAELNLDRDGINIKFDY